MTELHLLTSDEIEQIYNHYLIDDFPDNERRPLESILELYREKSYFGYGFRVNQALYGYALIYHYDGVFLLDYFAMLPKYRHQGMGQIFLKQLLELYKDHIFFLETENPKIEPNIIKEKRVQFYLRAGLKIQETAIDLYEVDYLLLANHPLKLLELEAFYHHLYPQTFYQRYIHFKKSNDE